MANFVLEVLDHTKLYSRYICADMLNIDKLLNVTDAHTDYIAISITLGHVLTA